MYPVHSYPWQSVCAGVGHALACVYRMRITGSDPEGRGGFLGLLLILFSFIYSLVSLAYSLTMLVRDSVQLVAILSASACTSDKGTEMFSSMARRPIGGIPLEVALRLWGMLQ